MWKKTKGLYFRCHLRRNYNYQWTAETDITFFQWPEPSIFLHTMLQQVSYQWLLQIIFIQRKHTKKLLAWWWRPLFLPCWLLQLLSKVKCWIATTLVMFSRWSHLLMSKWLLRGWGDAAKKKTPPSACKTTWRRGIIICMKMTHISPLSPPYIDASALPPWLLSQVSSTTVGVRGLMLSHWERMATVKWLQPSWPRTILWVVVIELAVWHD